MVGMHRINFFSESDRILPRRTVSERSIRRGFIASEMEQPGFLEIRSNSVKSISSGAFIMVFSRPEKKRANHDNGEAPTDYRTFHRFYQYIR